MLRDYQERISDNAVDKLLKHKIVYLAMQVRTGKTLTAFATALKFGAMTILFVTKKKAKTDIMSQLRDSGLLFYCVDVTNFEQLHNYINGYDLVIIDEAHSIGAFPKPTNRTKNLKEICKNTPIIYLSGTPSPESYSQLYHQFWVSSYSPFKEWANFYKWAKDGFVDIKQRRFNGLVVNDYKNANHTKIKEMTDDLFINFSQEEAGFTSYVDESILYVTMMPEVYKLADYLRKHKVAKNSSDEVILGDTEVKLMSKLHQIYSGTVILDEPTPIGKVIDYTKVDFIKTYFIGQKIAIYYKFKAELSMLTWIFSDKITFDPNLFNESEDLIFVSQIVAGREGINLSSADALVFLNIDFSAVSYWQTRARLQTKDRIKESKIYYIFSVGGIEDKIHKAVSNKQDFTLSYFKKEYL
jgi:hypothetical protein